MSYALVNKEYFDHLAPEADTPAFVIERSKRAGDAISQAYAFDPKSTVMLDYACGTGLLSKELFPHVKSALGVDISQGMVDAFNKRIQESGLSAERFRAVCAELKGELGELGGQKFDVIICSSAYHHFASIQESTRILVQFLRPGGALIVVDHMETKKDAELELHAISSQNIDHIVPHKHGFGRGEIEKVFIGAGLREFAFEKVPSAKDTFDLELFLAKGYKNHP